MRINRDGHLETNSGTFVPYVNGTSSAYGESVMEVGSRLTFVPVLFAPEIPAPSARVPPARQLPSARDVEAARTLHRFFVEVPDRHPTEADPDYGF